MVSVAHSSLTGADIHEPKGIETATANTVYVANGTGSGSWSTGSVLLGITGMIADFATPIAPSGWLECSGAAVSRSTYAALFAAITVQLSGTRTSGTKIITGLSSTASLAAGYSVGGTGIPVGSTISTVDSPTQVTISQNATSSGTSTVIFSPWAQGDGATTFNIPQMSGNYRRGRFPGTHNLGAAESDQIRSHGHGGSSVTIAGHNVADTTHTHPVVGTTASNNQNHTHNAIGTTAIQSVDHTHLVNGNTGSADRTLDHTHTEHSIGIVGSGGIGGGGSTIAVNTGNSGTSTLGAMDHLHAVSITSGGMSVSHTHGVNFATDIQNSAHDHGVNFTSGAGSSHTHAWVQDTTTLTIAASTAGTPDETRPSTVVCMTCIKT